MDRKESLAQEAKSIRVFKFYKRLTKALGYARAYRKVMLAAFVLGFITHVIGADIPVLNYLMTIGVIPGITFVLAAAVTHLLAGREISRLAKKYGMAESEIKVVIEENC